MIDATMMREPLGTAMILRRGQRLFATSRVQTYNGTDLREASYATVAHNAARLATGLRALGLQQGDRVGTFCWNSQEHLETYLAVPAMGCVLHTVNVRLFPEQIAWIINHAADRVLLVDAALLPALGAVLPALTTVEHVVVVGGGAATPVAGFAGTVHSYDALLDSPPLGDWPEPDENSAAVMCYTSGTTGNPKGVVYSHRSIFLHSLASMASDTFGICNADRLLMTPPMFHANAWGMPFSGWLAGSDLVMPGPHLQPDRLAALIALTRPTLTAAVPTILNDLLQLHARTPLDLSSFRTIVSGGSAVSPVLIERIKRAFGIDVVQGWGMTETSPMCVLSHPPRGTPPDEAAVWRARSGRPVPGVEVRIVDDANEPLAEDGTNVGRLQLRGPWIAAGYYRQSAAEAPISADGWLETGDVGTIDTHGYVQITDRTKDLIKSGGEWISSVELEHHIARFPDVTEVAVIAVPDPRWEERPLAVIATAGDTTVDYGALRQQLATQIARFMIPEYWTRLPALPKTSVGKIDKKQLREAVRNGRLTYACETGFGQAPSSHD